MLRDIHRLVFASILYLWQVPFHLSSSPALYRFRLLCLTRSTLFSCLFFHDFFSVSVSSPFMIFNSWLLSSLPVNSCSLSFSFHMLCNPCLVISTLLSFVFFKGFSGTVFPARKARTTQKRRTRDFPPKKRWHFSVPPPVRVILRLPSLSPRVLTGARS